MLDYDEGIPVFDSIAEVVGYAPRSSRTIAYHDPDDLAYSLFSFDEGNKQFFGVEVGVRLKLDGKPPVNFKRREIFGYYQSDDPWKVSARLSDTVLEARYDELAFDYSRLLVMDSFHQIAKALGIRPQLAALSVNPNDPNNFIYKSLEKNSGLYVPVIAF